MGTTGRWIIAEQLRQPQFCYRFHMLSGGILVLGVVGDIGPLEYISETFLYSQEVLHQTQGWGSVTSKGTEGSLMIGLRTCTILTHCS